MFNLQVYMLEKEIMELKIANTDLMYNKQALNALISDVNYTGLTEVCKCEGCYLAKRFSELDTDELIHRLKKSKKYGPCLLRKCLCWQLDRLGLTYHVHDCENSEEEDSSRDGETVENEDDDSGWARIAAKKDSHIVFIDEGEGVWCLEYGRKIADQPLQLNSCLYQLQELFGLLEVGEIFFEVEGKNYFALADEGSI